MARRTPRDAGPTARAAAAALIALLAASGCAPGPEYEPVELDELRGVLQLSIPGRRTERGLELAVVGEASVVLDRPGVRAMELEVEVDAPLYVVGAAYNGGAEVDPGPPFRATALEPGSGTVRIDLAECVEWRRESRPVLILQGTANVVVTGVRTAPAPADPEEFREVYDRATRWAPESLSGTTINFLTPPWWDSSRERWWPDRLALLGLVAGVAAWLVARRRGRPGAARAGLATGVLTAALAWNGLFALRMAPALEFAPTLDPEERIRANFHFAPDVGALAALARATLGPDERVGVLGSPGDWSGPASLCYWLAPRRCVVVEPGRDGHVGLSGVERLRTDELDALVVTESAAALPPGFERVAEVSPRSYVARRR